MKKLVVAVALGLFAGSCTTIEQINDEDRVLTYGCDDVVVVGRLQNQDAYALVPIEGDLIGHGWMLANLVVDRTVHGSNIPREISVRYLAHTYLREDRDFMFVLSRTENGYQIETAQLLSVRPRAVDTCS